MSDAVKSTFQRVLLLDSNPDTATKTLESMQEIDLFKVRPRSAANTEEAMVFLKAVVFDVLFVSEKYIEEFGVEIFEEMLPFLGETPVVLIGENVDVHYLVLDFVREKDISPSVIARSLLYVRACMSFHKERELLQSEVQHSQKTEIFGQLCGGIVHDFNNKLAVISANIMRAILDIDDKEKTRLALNKAMATVSESASLVKELLRFAKKAEPKNERVALHDCVGKTVDYLKELVGGAVQISYTKLPTEQLLETVPVQIDQIVMNLVLNARDAVGIKGEINIETGERDSNLYLKISDNGCGMSPVKLEKIFEPFYTTKGSEKGTGLGLSIVRRLVEEMGAKIHVESALGQGTTFEIVWSCNDEKVLKAA